MRKAIIILSLLTMSASCSSEHEGGRDVYLTLDNPESGAFKTKTPTLESDIANVLSETAPTTNGLILHVQSKTKNARSYDIQYGNSAFMAYDSYTVTANWNSNSVMSIRGGKLNSTPSYTISSDISVTEDDYIYPISASWNSAAIIIKPSELSSVQITSAASGMDEILNKFVIVGSYGILYVTGSGWSSNNKLVVSLTPSDDVNFENSAFSFTDNSLQKGYWYYLSPSAVDVVTGGFNIVFPSWEQGEL